MAATGFALVLLVLALIGCGVCGIGLIVFLSILIYKTVRKKKGKKLYILPGVAFVVGVALIVPFALFALHVRGGIRQEKEKVGELYYSVSHGDADRAEKLLAAGADVNRGDGSRTPLMKACFCETRNDELVRQLLEKGADVRAVDGDGDSAITYSLTNYQAPDAYVVSLLLQHGANVNEHGDTTGVTPLWLACGDGNARGLWDATPAVQVLLQYGAPVSGSDSKGITPLMRACGAGEDSFGNFDYKLVKLLVDNGADSKAKSAEGYTALDYLNRRHEDDKNWEDYQKWATAGYEANYADIVQLLTAQ